MIKTVYKVVDRKSNLDLTSYVSSFAFGLKIELDYNINETTYPEIDGSKLFVFKDLQSAESYIGHWYIGHWNSKLILKCEAEILDESQDFEKYYGGSTLTAITSFLKDGIRVKGIQQSPPEGTLLAEWVKPLKVIK